MALDRLTKVDGGGISTTSDYRVGIITASKFVGPFDGTGGNFSGVITATNGVFSGNVTIGGTLTYEDVTNIDSVGLVTAREGIFLPDNKEAKFGNTAADPDLKIYHNGTNNYVDAIRGSLLFRNTQPTNTEFHTGNFLIKNQSNNQTVAQFAPGANGGGKLYHENVLRFNTTSTGAVVTGILTVSQDLDVDGHTNLDNVSISGVTTITSIAPEIHFTDTNHDSDYSIVVNSGRLRFKDRTNSDVDRFYITSDGGNYLNGDVHLGEILFGTGSRTRVYGGGGTHVKNALMVTNPSASVTGRGAGVALCGIGQTNDYIGTLYVRRSALGDNRGTTYLEAKDDIIINTNAATSTKTVLTAGADGNISINNDLDVDGHTNLDNVSVAGVTTFSTSPVVPNGTYYKGVINSGSQQKIVGGYISGSNTLRLGESMYLTMNPERLGLGINDPQRTLHLSSNNTVIALTDTAAGTNQKTKYILSDAGVFAIGKLSDDYNTATEHLYIDNDGLVIINRNGYGTADVNADNFVVKTLSSSSSCGVSILSADNQNSTLYFGNASDSKHAEVVWSDASNLFLIGTSNTGASIKFRVSNQADAILIDNNGNLKISNNTARIRMGSSNQLELYHTGTYGYLNDTSSSGTELRIAGRVVRVMDNDSSHTIAYFAQANAKFYADNVERLKTTDTGINVVGEVTSSQDYPNIRPLLDFNFANVKKLDPILQYERTGPASFTDEFGKVVLVGDNVPRFDHNPITRECRGLLIEESRINLVEDNTNYTGWLDYSSTHAKTTDVKAPDGSFNAWKVTSTGAQNQFGIYDAIGYTANTKYTHSMWLKAGTATRVGLTVSSGSKWSVMPYLIVDLDTGTVNATGSSLSTKLTAYPNGWYLLEATGQFGSSSQSDGIWSYTAQTGGFSGNSTAYFYQWGGQAEAGAFATSFIPTIGSNTTRGQDFLVMEGSDVDDNFNPTEGTMFYEASVANLADDNQPIVSFRNSLNTAEEYFSMGHAIGGSAGSVRVWSKNSDGQNVHLTTHTGLVADTPYKHAFGYAYNNYSDAFTQGTTSNQVNTTSGNHAMMATGVVNELRFGAYYTNLKNYKLKSGHIKRFSYWPVRLTNTQLKTYIS